MTEDAQHAMKIVNLRKETASIMTSQNVQIGNGGMDISARQSAIGARNSTNLMENAPAVLGTMYWRMVNVWKRKITITQSPATTDKWPSITDALMSAHFVRIGTLKRANAHHAMEDIRLTLENAAYDYYITLYVYTNFFCFLHFHTLWKILHYY